MKDLGEQDRYFLTYLCRQLCSTAKTFMDMRVPPEDCLEYFVQEHTHYYTGTAKNL